MDCDASPPWAELPADTLGEIAGRLRDATDRVRFHALCRPWRKAPTPHRAPSLLLPWLIAQPRSEFSNLNTHSPFSNKSLCLPCVPDLRHRQLKCSDAANGRVLAMGFLNHDPMAAVVNPLTGSATCFPLPLSRDPETDVFEQLDTIKFHLLTAMLRHNNETGMERTVVPLTYPPLGCPRTVFLYPYRLRLAALHSSSVLTDGGKCAMAEPPSAKSFWDRYVLEYQGKLFCVDVPRPWRYPRHVSASVSVYAMEVGRPRWVEWEHTRDTDGHVCFFLGWESSFAMDAREFAGAEVTGSFAYYVDIHKEQTLEHIWGVYRYSFEDQTTTMLDELPAGFDITSMWFVPRPSLPQSNNNN